MMMMMRCIGHGRRRRTPLDRRVIFFIVQQITAAIVGCSTVAQCPHDFLSGILTLQFSNVSGQLIMRVVVLLIWIVIGGFESIVGVDVASSFECSHVGDAAPMVETRT